MNRRARQVCVPWLTAVLSIWLVATVLLAAWATEVFGHESATASILHSVSATSIVCVAVGGPATAVALWLRQRLGAGQSALGGVAAAIPAFVVVFLVVIHSGLVALTAAAPVLAIIAIELPVALTVRARLLRRRAALDGRHDDVAVDGLGHVGGLVADGVGDVLDRHAVAAHDRDRGMSSFVGVPVAEP
jgi:hypothetical protein